MAQQGLKRKHAALHAADIVGHTTLMNDINRRFPKGVTLYAKKSSDRR